MIDTHYFSAHSVCFKLAADVCVCIRYGSFEVQRVGPFS